MLLLALHRLHYGVDVTYDRLPVFCAGLSGTDVICVRFAVGAAAMLFGQVARPCVAAFLALTTT